MSKVIGILDTDIRYSNRLMEYLKRRKRVMMQVRVFSDVNNMNKFLEHNKLDILMLGENLFPLPGSDYSNIHTVILSEENMSIIDMAVARIYKYQSVESLIDELIRLCPELKEGEESGHNGKELNIRAIYSLGNGGIGETFSYLLAKECGNIGKVLFINLVPFSGLRETMITENHKGMSDIIYYVNEKVGSIKDKLALIIKNNDNLDLVLNITFSTDLFDLTSEGIKLLLNAIRECNKYTYCIINTDFVNSAVLELYGQCEKLYMVTCKEEMICRRMDNLVKQLEWAGLEEILKKLIQIDLTEEEQVYIYKSYEEGVGEERIKEYIKHFI